MTTVFSLLPLNANFTFIGSNIVWQKVTEFSAINLYAIQGFAHQISAIDGIFRTDSIVITF